MCAELFLPKMQRIGSWWNSAYHIMPIATGKGVKWCAGNVPPTFHPVVRIAGYFDYFRLLNRHANLLFESWLSHINDRIDDRFGMDIVQDSIGIEYGDGAAGGENRHMRSVLASLLIEADRRKWLQGRGVVRIG